MMKWDNYHTSTFMICFLVLNLFVYFGVENERNPFPSPIRISYSKRDDDQIATSNQNEKSNVPNKVVVTDVAEKEKIIKFNQNLDVKLSIEPPPCESNVRLLIAIKSLPSNIQRRSAIRETWGMEENFKQFPVRRVFLLARSKNLDKNGNFDQNPIRHEAEKHRDILQGNFFESFYNLTLKESLLLKWYQTACKVDFIFKGDDDIFLNPPKLESMLSNIRPNSIGLYGSRLVNSPRIKNPKSKYYVSSNLWPEDYYPKYVSGGGFIMTRRAADGIYSVLNSTPMIPIDDAYVGICMLHAGYTNYIYNDGRFRSWGIKKRFDVCEISKAITIHRYSPSELRSIWPSFLNKSC